MNPMDAAWSILKADPNLRMVHGGGFPSQRGGGRSQTLHPAIAGLLTKRPPYLDFADKELDIDDIALNNPGHLDTYHPPRYRDWPQPYSEAPGNLDPYSTDEQLNSAGSRRSLGPVHRQGAPKPPDRVLHEMSKDSPYRAYDTANMLQIDDPSQNEEFMQVFNAYPEKLRQFYEQQGDMDVQPHSRPHIAGHQDFGRVGRRGNPDNIQMIPDMMGQM